MKMTNEPDGDTRRRLKSFGRMLGRPLSARQQGLVDHRLPCLSVEWPEAGGLEPSSLFAGDPPVWLEIGFGGAEHLIEQAGRHPGTGFIGCEPFLEGVAKALTGIEDHGLGNVRLHPGDARDLIDALVPESVSRVFILFPDPWPKKRHQKRRIVQPDFLDALHRALKPGAPVRFATDVMSYANEALAKFIAHGGFDWLAESSDDWRIPPADHVTTRYESKQLGDCAPVFFEFRTRAPEPSLIVT